MRLVTPSWYRKLTSDLEFLRAKREALRQNPPRGLHRRVDEFSAEPPNPTDAVFLEHLLERQIATLEDILASATVRPDPADGQLDVGDLARLRDLDTGEAVEYRIVGVGEADPATGSISYTSPVGAAMVGRRVGDVIDVEVPSGTLRFEVIGIAP